jgi:hypothetical protein
MNVLKIISTSEHNPAIKTFAEHTKEDLSYIFIDEAGHAHFDNIEEGYNVFMRDNKKEAFHESEIDLVDGDSNEGKNIAYIFMSYQLTLLSPNFSVLIYDSEGDSSPIFMMAELPLEYVKLNTEHSIDLMKLIRQKLPGFVVPPKHHLALSVSGGVLFIGGILVGSEDA